MALVEAVSRRLDFEQSRDGSATGSKQPANVPIDFPTGSGNLKVRLVFVRGMAGSDKQQPGKHDWVVFLSTDSNLEPQKMLELYAMRWAIEVYFSAIAAPFLRFLAVPYSSTVFISLCNDTM